MTSGPETLPEYVVPFDRLSLDDISRVGGKNASLGEMVKALAPQGIRIPDGFALTADAFRLHLKEAGLDSAIYAELDHVDVEDVAALASAARSIRARIAAAPLPAPVAAAVETAYQRLSATYGEDATDVAVRSSATAEDLPTASFAGQQETYLNVRVARRWIWPSGGAWRRSSPTARSCIGRSTGLPIATWRSQSGCRRWSAATSARRA